MSTDPGYKLQATSLTAGPRDDRMNLDRNKYGHNTIEKNSRRPGGDPSAGKRRSREDAALQRRDNREMDL